MLRGLYLRRKLFDVGVFLAACGLLGYFVWQAENGPRSVSYKSSILFEYAEKQKELAEWRGKREQLSGRVDLMRSEAIDPDLLGELARAELGMVRDNEIVVPLN